VSEHKALLNRKVNDDVACTKEAVEKEDVEQQPDVVDQKPRSVNMVKQWSSAFMTMVTMAVMATTTATATIMENALPLGLVAGVITTGLHEPVVNGLWDAKTLLQEDMMPNFNYEDIFFGPTKSRHYSYEIGHVSDGATNVIETQYRYNPHDAAAESRLSPIAQYVFTIPTKPEGDDVGAEQHITNVRKWRTENKHVTHEYETKPNDGGSTERPSNKINNATHESTSPQAQCPLQARMQDRDLEYTDEEAEEYVVRAVRGTGVDQSQTLWDQLECDNSDWCKKNRVQVRAMLHKHKTVFECDGKQPPFVDKEGKVVEIPIHLTDEEPVAQRAWRLSPEKLAVLDQYLDELLDQGVIEPTKYSPYSAVTVLVPKKGQFDKAGLQRLRVTTDYRRLNRKTRKLAYNGKTVQEMFDMVDGATIFSTYDVSSAFYNLKLRADAREKTAFSTPHRGLFQYLRLPMGLSVSPGILACEYEEMFRVPVTINGKYHPQALGAIVGIYCDDVIAFSNEEDHLEVNKFVLATLKKHNVNLRADKSFIGRAEVEYLGMVISGDGISISPSKTKAVWEAKKPTNAEETRRFLGMASYLRSFVPDFGANSKHLTANLAKGVTWQWDDRHEREYRYLLNAICSDNCLAPFSWGKESILRTDSSAAGYGAVLCQMHGRLRRPVAFISRQLNGTEASRPGRDLEAGCLTWACQKFRNYLIHRPFIVHGDCSNLQWVHKYEGNNRRLYNYSLILSQYQMRFVYKKGSTMGDCDWLSRSAVKQARDETDADNPDHNMPEVGSDLGATPYSDSRIASTKAIDPNDISSTLRQWDEEHATEEASVATLRQKARQPRQGARNTYHCCKKGTVGRGRCPNICPQFWLAPDNKLYCTACLPNQWEQRARSISVSDWDRHSLLSEEYRQREHWHRLGWNKSEHNNDFDCDSGCPCCKAEAGEFFSSCPVCNEDLYGDARPLWDIDEALKGRAENALRRTGHYKPNKTRGTARSPARSHQGGEAAPKTQNVSIVKRQKVKPAWVKRVPKPHQPPLIFTDKKARTDDPVPAYSVLSVGGGIGTDAMATADFDHMKVTVACESDEKTAKLAQNRTGTPMYRCTRELVDHLRSGKIEQPDVLSYTGELSRDHDDLLRVIDAASPTVIMAESTDQITGISTSDAVDAARIKDTQHSNIKLEATLHKQGYVVESATLNASEHGGHTANTRYILVAHKTKAYYKWPEQRTKFPGCTEILQHAHTVDPRTRRRGYQPVEGQPQGNFSPWKAGFIKGGGEYRGVYDPTNPLPAIRPHYNKHTREHGGQYVVDSEGTRLLTQTEEMRLLHFTEEAISQLQDETPWVQQHCVGTASCVALKTALFASIQDLLDAAQTTPGLAMPREHKAYGILAHAVMPSLHEISVAQGKDPEVRQLLTYVAADEKQRRDMVLPKQYERHAKFMHLNDGILFYRDILNDEWLTDAVVLPPSLIEKAMVAFHDSGYGGHQGFHKTKVAMQERVWFPKMSKTITDHIDNCDACKRAKAIRRKHAGKSQSSLYREAFEVVAIDLMGPYLKSSDGNMYIMHVIDLFTNWNIAVAIPNKEAKTIASAFHEHVILKEAETPAAIISDRGTEFLNTLFAELTAQFNLAHYKTTPLHPTGNAANERQHRTYGAILKTMLHKYGKEFDEALPYATYAINTHAIEGTNVSPFEMRYGRKPKCPNSVAATDNPAWTALKATMSSAEHIKMLRERMADAQINVQMARLQVTRKNQAQMAKHHYEKHFNVGDLLLRWTGNTKRGLYGKLGYTTVGPFEVVSIHKRNRDIYELRHLASPDKGTSMHHVRELCPYITKEAHEKQHANEAVNQPISKLDPKVGDYLLLPNGSRDFLCKVLSVQHGRVLFQYLNKENPGKGSVKPYTALKLTWMRKKPSNNPFDELASDDWEEKYCHQLTPAQVASGWKAYDETLSVDEFYQRIVYEKDLLKTPNGITLTPSKRAVITKLRPVHMQ
jgi:transposase InsO family protein